MIAQKVALAGILGDDIKHVLTVEGLDLSDTTITFEIAAGPEQPALITGTCDVLSSVTDEDGIHITLVEVFASASSIRPAIAGLGGLPANEDLPLFYQLKFSELPGDAGSDAVTTILYGDYIMKGEVNG